MNPYGPEYDYSDAPTASGVILFVGLLAAIILAAAMWASVSPPDVPPGATGNPGISQPAAPVTPRMPSTAPAE
jgi:hypothetical protein